MYVFFLRCISNGIISKKELERSKQHGEEFRVSAEKLDQMNKELLKKNHTMKEETEKEIAEKLITLQKKLTNHRKDFESAISSEVCYGCLCDHFYHRPLFLTWLN